MLCPASVVVPAQRHIAEATNSAPGQAQGHEVLVLAHRRRGGIGIGFAALEPERLRDHPLRRHRPGTRAVDLQRRVAGREHRRRLGPGAHVHPDDRRADRAGVPVERHDGAAGGVHGNGPHSICRDASIHDGAPHGGGDGAPPILRVLLGAPAGGKVRLVGMGGRAEAAACLVVNAAPQALGAAVNANDVAHGRQALSRIQQGDAADTQTLPERHVWRALRHLYRRLSGVPISVKLNRAQDATQPCKPCAQPCGR